MPCPCQLCSSPNGTVHLTELAVDGARSELHLCRDCVARLGIALDAPPPLSQLLTQQPAGDEEGGTVAVPAPEPGAGTCPQCGLEFTAYIQSNLFGCPECYSAFAPQVAELVSKYHGASVHVGRMPAGGSSGSLAAQRHSARTALQAALQEAVSREQFERAAHLRDQLRVIEAELAEPPSQEDEP